MIVFESRQRRVLVGRVEAGESVVSALVHMARAREVTTAWVSATGSLRSIVLDFTDLASGGRTDPRPFGGGLELLSLSGNLSSAGGELVLEATAQVARLTDNGVEVLGGHLVDAVAHAVELRVECYDDLGLRREVDGALGLALWRGESTAAREDAPRRAPPAPPPPAQPSGVSWALAAQVSAEREAGPAIERRRPSAPSAPMAGGAPLPFVPDPLPARKRTGDDEPTGAHSPERGDFVDHKQFGLCRVEKVSDDGGLVIRLETGRRKLIKLDVLDVLDPREEGGKRVYPLRPRRR